VDEHYISEMKDRAAVLKEDAALPGPAHMMTPNGTRWNS
jgi:hypothetical protein